MPKRRPVSSPARGRNGARRACSGDAAGACSSIRCCSSACATTPARRRRRSNARCCAARGRAPAATGLAHALETFRAQLEKFRGKEESDLHRSDPRIGLSDSELAAAAELVAQAGDALAPLESIGRIEPHRSAMWLRAIAKSWRRCRATARGAAFAGPDGIEACGRARRTGDEQSRRRAAWSRRPTMSNCFPPRSPAGSCARRRSGRARAHSRTLEARLTDSDRVVLGGLVEGTWPPESRTDAWLSRPMRLELGLDLPERRDRPLRARFRANARRARSDPHSRRQARRRADGAVALRPAARRCRRRGAVAGGARSRRSLSRLGARLDRPASVKARAAARAEAAVARRGRGAFRLPRSNTGCAIPIRSMPSIFCVSRRSTPSMPRPARRSAARSSTPRSANSASVSRTVFRPMRRGELIETGPQTFRRAGRFSRSARVLVAALQAHRALVRRLGGRSAAPLSVRWLLRSAAKSRFRFPMARSRCAASPTGSSAMPTAAM